MLPSNRRVNCLPIRSVATATGVYPSETTPSLVTFAVEPRRLAVVLDDGQCKGLVRSDATLRFGPAGPSTTDDQLERAWSSGR